MKGRYRECRKGEGEGRDIESVGRERGKGEIERRGGRER